MKRIDKEISQWRSEGDKQNNREIIVNSQKQEIGGETNKLIK